MKKETQDKLEAAKGKSIATAKCCKEKILSLWQSGPKGKAICGGMAVAVLLIIGLLSCSGGESSETSGKHAVAAKVCKLSPAALSEKKFDSIFSGGSGEDEGTIYFHHGGPYVKIYQSTSDGLLVGYDGAYANRLVWILAKSGPNEEDTDLKPGFFVRQGMYSYVGVDGGEHTLARYIEISNPKDVDMLKAEVKRRADEKFNAAEKAAALADERGAYELDIPIKSLCGFKLGVPPSQVKDLLQIDEGTPVAKWTNQYVENRLAKPFRLFTHAQVFFRDIGVGKHLEGVKLIANLDPQKVSDTSRIEEVESTVQLIEKKFGIKFEGGTEGKGMWTSTQFTWEDKNTGESIWIESERRFIFLTLDAGREISRLDDAAKEASKKSIHLGADAGADQL